MRPVMDRARSATSERAIAGGYSGAAPVEKLPSA